MAAHNDRARAADELQFRRTQRLGKFGVNNKGDRHSRDRHRYRDDGAALRHILGFHVRNAIEIVVVMDGRTVMMVAILCVVGNGVNVEGKRLRLQQTHRQNDENG